MIEFQNNQLTAEEIELKKLEINFYSSFKSILLDYLIEEVIPESNKEIIKSFTEGIREIKYVLDNSKYGREYVNEILVSIKYSLVESIYIRQSMYIRYVLKSIFLIEYMCSDREIISTIISTKDLPYIFSLETPILKSMEIEDILSMPLKMKPLGKLFDNYSTSYPFDKSSAKEELMQLSFSLGRILIHENYLFLYTGIVPSYISTIYSILEEDGNITISWRYFIALMAVSSINCYYLVKHLQEMFILKGGEEDWIIYGINSVPEKLRKLSKINNILAHQPWKLTVKDVNSLLVGNNCWNREEFVQAATILISFHRLATIVEALKINLIENRIIQIETENEVETKLDDSSKEENGQQNLYKNLIEMNETNEKKIQSKDRKISLDDIKIQSEGDKADNSVFKKFTSSHCTIYQDFDSYSDNYLSNMTFNWDDEGSYILQNIFSKGIECINTEMNYYTDLTSKTIGGETKKLDTFHFRNAIRCYIEKIFGIFNDDYDYSKTNKLLRISTKTFIKNVTCLPKKISAFDIPILRFTFSHEEIIHLILVASTHKQRVALTFLSHVIYDIIKSID